MELKKLNWRPRYLRAIPSLVVLTTAMAWGAAPDVDVMDAAQKKAGVTLSHGRVQSVLLVLDAPPRPENSKKGCFRR